MYRFTIKVIMLVMKPTITGMNANMLVKAIIILITTMPKLF